VANQPLTEGALGDAKGTDRFVSGADAPAAVEMRQPPPRRAVPVAVDVVVLIVILIAGFFSLTVAVAPTTH